MKEFTIIIENAGASFSAYSPDVPGCIATGKTVAETQHNFQQALQFHLDGLRADGIAVPEPNSIAVRVSVAA